ncbi:Holliday junction branch migration protein RuvA [Anaerolineales bacterium]
MISSLEGRVSAIKEDRIMIIVGGVGLEVFASRPTLETVTGESVFLFTRLIVREDSLTLFGFAQETERDVFDILVKVNGVGPRLALAILSTLSIDNLRNAVASERVELLTRVPGIGRKTAQKIMLELKDKLPIGLDTMPTSDFYTTNSEVMDALIALGYSVVEAQSAIQSLPMDAPDNVEERIRLTLSHLSKF